MACCVQIETGNVGVIENCGKFQRLAPPGCTILCCPFEVLSGVISTRVQQLDVMCETKTLDNVFVKVNVSVQYMVNDVMKGYYELSDPQTQMRTYVYDNLRASICSMTLDHSFDARDEISDQIKHHLQKVFGNYGFQIHQTLVTDISPNDHVKNAMNEINASKRIKEASYQRAEGEKVLKVKRAEAEAESMHLSGVGVARSRHAIMDGLKESIVEFSNGVSGTSAKDVMDLLVLTQYFDTLTEIGKKPGTRVCYLPADKNSIRNGIMEANSVA